jgi:hypothetical protein
VIGSTAIGAQAAAIQIVTRETGVSAGLWLWMRRFKVSKDDQIIMDTTPDDSIGGAAPRYKPVTKPCGHACPHERQAIWHAPFMCNSDEASTGI